MNEEDKQDFAEQASDDVFSQMDADGDGVVTREEFEAAQKDTPTLTGEVGFFELEEDKSLTPEDKPKEKMNKNLQFFLGVVVYPILVLIISSLIASIGWAFDESGQVSGFLQMMTMGGGYVGGVVVGFTSGHHSFAWGLLASIIILPLLLFALLFGFCMIIIMSDGGTI